jgi:hypothetical protein
MAGINGMGALERSTGENLLIAAYGNDLVNAVSGVSYGQAISPDRDVDFAVLLDYLFFQNSVNTPITFDGTNWGRTHVAKTPVSSFMEPWNNRMYLGSVILGGTTYSSRVAFSNLPKNDVLHWGYETGSDLKTWAGGTSITSALSGFKEYGLKRGDPVFITSGNDQGEYRIETVDSNQRLTLTEALENTASSISFWAGGNWFDVNQDDGDFLNGLAVNNNQLLAYKRDSLYRYDQDQLRKVPRSPGTTSNNSIVTMKRKEWTISFHGAVGTETGFYAYDGRESFKLSSHIDKYVEGINPNNYGSIVAWEEEGLYRAYVGDLTNARYNISLSNVVITIDTITNSYSIDPIDDEIRAAVQFRQGSVKQPFLGTADSQVVKSPSGTDFNGSSVPWIVELNPIYPAGTERVNTMTRLQVISDFANGTRVLYKLLLKPFKSDTQWKSLGEISSEKTELEFREDDNIASGVLLRFQGTDIQTSTATIKKATLFYRPETESIS